MNIRQYLQTFVLHFFLIYALTMLATMFFCLANGTGTVAIDYFWQSALFSLAADAPLAVFISREELTRKQFWIRVVLHGALLECLLMPIGHLLEMWRGVGGGFAFFFTVVAVSATMYFLEFLKNKDVQLQYKQDHKKAWERARRYRARL